MPSATEVETGHDIAVFPSDTLAEEAEKALEESGYAVLRRLRCDCSDGVISIRGRVPTYFLKQMAQAAVSRIRGVRRVNNLISVT